MTAAPPITAATIAEPAQPGRGVGCVSGEGREPDPTDRYIRMLDRMAELGMVLVERLVETVPAASPEPGAAPAEPELTPAARAAKHPDSLAFDRLTRAVRLCMALSLKFYNDRLERERKGAADPVVPDQQRKPRRRGQIKRLVMDIVERKRDPFEKARLRHNLEERLEEEDIERDLLDRPLGELIARICNDLGIEPDWEFWSSDYWAEEEARIKPSGSPYVEWRAPEAPDPAPPEPEPEKPLRPKGQARPPKPPSG